MRQPAAPLPLATAGEVGKGTSWRAAARAGCDIITLAWLQRCADAGQFVEPRPCEYLQLSAATLQASGCVKRFIESGSLTCLNRALIRLLWIEMASSRSGTAVAPTPANTSLDIALGGRLAFATAAAHPLSAEPAPLGLLGGQPV